MPCPGAPAGPSAGVWVGLSVCPWMKSFSREKAQTELAWNLDARLKFVAGSPPVGGPFTSPANAAPEPRPMNNAAETAAAEREHFIFSSFGCEPKRARANLPALLQTG